MASAARRANTQPDDLVTLLSVLEKAETALSRGESAAPRTWETGFDLLDAYLGGGLRAGELVLLGGPQGLGKTTFVLQILRHVVQVGGRGLLFSFEHDEQTLLERFISIEAAEVAGEEGVPLRLVRQAMLEAHADGGGLAERLAQGAGGPEGLQAVVDYGDRLSLHRSSGRTTTVDLIRERVLEAVDAGEAPVVVVDYLQKVLVPDAVDEEDRVTRVVEGLKDLALEAGVTVLAVVAADAEGIRSGRRLFIHNLRGSSALAYEADVVLLLNEKYDIVARHHLVYDSSNAERYRNYAILSVDKNRSGLDKVDMELRKRFEQGRFERTGRAVQEQLVDTRVFVD